MVPATLAEPWAGCGAVVLCDPESLERRRAASGSGPLKAAVAARGVIRRRPPRAGHPAATVRPATWANPHSDPARLSVSVDRVSLKRRLLDKLGSVMRLDCRNHHLHHAEIVGPKITTWSGDEGPPAVRKLTLDNYQPADVGSSQVIRAGYKAIDVEKRVVIFLVEVVDHPTLGTDVEAYRASQREGFLFKSDLELGTDWNNYGHGGTRRTCRRRPAPVPLQHLSEAVPSLEAELLDSRLSLLPIIADKNF